MFVRVALFVALGIINMSLFFFMIWGQNGLLSYHKLKDQLPASEDRQKLSGKDDQTETALYQRQRAGLYL